jgi:hypothetical protein
MPIEYASGHKRANDPFDGDYELKEDAFRFVAKLAASGARSWEFIHAEEPDGEHFIIHQGLVEGRSVRIPLQGNSVKDGMPERYEVLPEPDDDDKPRRRLTNEEWERIEAMRAKREFFAAKERLMEHPDKALREAIKTLAKYRETPGLWLDLSTFIRAGGPDSEHRTDNPDDPTSF